MENLLLQKETAMFLLCAITIIGITFEIILKAGCRKLQLAAGDIKNTEDKMMKQMRVSFEDKCKKMDNVNNVDKFVDNYVYNYSFCGMKLLTINDICKKIYKISLILSVLIGVTLVYINCGQREILLTIMFEISTLLLLTLFAKNVDNYSFFDLTRSSIINYFENDLRNIYISKKEIVELETDIEDELSIRDIVVTPKEKSIRVNKIDCMEKKVNENQDNRVDEILKEFLA